jgi:hypothetical protein
MPQGDDVRARLDAWLGDADRRLDTLEAQLSDGPATSTVVAAPPTATDDGHVLFVPSPDGYALVERDGAPPAAGDTLQLDEPEGRYAVTKVVDSPMPDDVRPCAYLQPV